MEQQSRERSPGPPATPRRRSALGRGGGSRQLHETVVEIAGRYRLRARIGRDPAVHAQFWRARDIMLAREVGLTILSRSGRPEVATPAGETIAAARRGGRFEHPGRARLLEVIHSDTGGLAAALPDDVLAVAVTEWLPGQTLAQTVATGPLRTATVLAMLNPLAQAASEAHRRGLVLGCAHPQRIRITPDGVARVAFALPHPDTTPADDVLGLGAALYALLTGYWPWLCRSVVTADVPEC